MNIEAAGDYQMVVMFVSKRIMPSRVIKGKPSVSAVAAMMRSERRLHNEWLSRLLQLFFQQRFFPIA
jgi:hypothetical protein